MRKWMNNLPHGQLLTSAAYLVVAFGLGIGTVVYTGTDQGSQRVVYEDVIEGEDSVVSIEENEVPLSSAPKVTKSKKTNTKKVKMKKKAKKSSKKTKTSETSDKKTKKSGGKTVVTETDVKTTVQTKTKKNSNVKTIKTTVLTTVTTTETSGKAASVISAKASAYEYEVSGIADIEKSVDADVYKAFNDLGFSYIIDSSLSTSGVFSVKNHWIKTKEGKSTHLLHELGHFVSALEDDAASTSEWNSIYAAEKGLYTGTNATYVTSTASEYFAESFREYSEDAATLSASRPKTYNYINNVVTGIDVDEDVKTFQSDYGWYWE